VGRDEITPEDRDVVTALMKRDIDDLRRSIEDLKTSNAQTNAKLDDLVQAWATAGNVVTFVKWLAGLAAAVAVLTGAVKGWFGN
jgi:hypothetical protein